MLSNAIRAGRNVPQRTARAVGAAVLFIPLKRLTIGKVPKTGNLYPAEYAGLTTALDPADTAVSRKPRV
jgi:hypothetical protein